MLRTAVLLLIIAAVAVVAGPVRPVIDNTGSFEHGAPQANLTRFNIKPKIDATLVKDAALAALLETTAETEVESETEMETEVETEIKPIVDGTGSLGGGPRVNTTRFSVKPKIDASLVSDVALNTAPFITGLAAPKALLSLSAEAEAAATPVWDSLSKGISTIYRGNPCRFLVTFSPLGWGTSASQNWNQALYTAASFSKLGVSNQISVKGPSDAQYSQREFTLSNITARFESINTECGGKQVVVVVAAAEGSIVANEFLNYVNSAVPNWTARTVYYNVDGFNDGLEKQTVKKLALYYPTTANKLPTATTPLVPSVQFADMGTSFRTYVNRHLLVLDASSTQCTTAQCVREFLLNTNPVQVKYLLDTSNNILNLVKNPAKPAAVQVGATSAQAATAAAAANPTAKPAVPPVPTPIKCGPAPTQLIGECQSIHEHCSGTYLLNKCPGGHDFMCCIPDQPTPVKPTPKPVTPTPAKPVTPTPAPKPVTPTPAKPVTPTPAPAKPVTPTPAPGQETTAQLIDELIDRGVDALGDVAANAINKLTDKIFGNSTTPAKPATPVTPAKPATPVTPAKPATPVATPTKAANGAPLSGSVKCGAGNVGSCRWIQDGCNGSFQRGLCPSGANFQCCLPAAKKAVAVQRAATPTETKTCKEAAAIANAALRTAELTSRGLALEYVTKYIDAAGISFFPSDSAAASGKDLITSDFKPLAANAALLPGDIRVFPGVTGFPDGHIQVYTGAPNALWTSDYKQTSNLPSSAFKAVAGDAYTYRYVCRT